MMATFHKLMEHYFVTKTNTAYPITRCQLQRAFNTTSFINKTVQSAKRYLCFQLH